MQKKTCMHPGVQNGQVNEQFTMKQHQETVREPNLKPKWISSRQLAIFTSQIGLDVSDRVIYCIYH